MLGVAQMPFKQRVSALSYHQENRLLLCGDQSGNIAVFDVTGLRTSALFNNATINSPYGLWQPHEEHMKKMPLLLQQYEMLAKIYINL